MCRNEPWEAIAVPMEAHSKQRGQPPRVPPFHRSKGTATPGAQDEIAELLEVGRSKAQMAPPDQGRDTEYDPVLEM